MTDQDNKPRFRFDNSTFREDYEFVCRLDEHDVWCHKETPRFRLYYADNRFWYLGQLDGTSPLGYDGAVTDPMRAVWAMKYGKPL